MGQATIVGVLVEGATLLTSFELRQTSRAVEDCAFDKLAQSAMRVSASRALIARQMLIVADAFGNAQMHEMAVGVLLLLQDGLFELEQMHGMLVRLSRADPSEPDPSIRPRQVVS